MSHLRNQNPYSFSEKFRQGVARTGLFIAEHVQEASLFARFEEFNGIGQKLDHAAQKIVGYAQRVAPDFKNGERALQQAYHEAGHAVLIVLMSGGENIAWLNMMDNRHHSACMTWNMPKISPQDKREILNAMTIYLGGPAAEKIQYGHLLDTSYNDFFRAGEIYTSNVKDASLDADVILDVQANIFGAAEQVLEANWEAVEALAPIAAKRKILSRAEICDIVEPHLSTELDMDFIPA